MEASLNSPYTNTRAFTRPRATSQDYPTETIGYQEGASLLRQHPQLGRSGIPTKPNSNLGKSSDRKGPSRSQGPPQEPPPASPSQFKDSSRFPPGTLASQDSELDPMQRLPSPNGQMMEAPYGDYDEDSSLNDENDQLHGQWLAHPQPQHASNPGMPAFALEHASEDSEHLRMEEEERRARHFAQLSDAEQYAVQAKIYAQGHHNHYDDTQQHPSSGDSGQEEGSLASPFRQRPKATQHKAPASRASQTGPAGSRSTSRTEKGATRRVTSSKGNKALQGSTTSLAYASDSNAGLSKDELLERMADALRKERAKNKSYMKELQESELEIDAISRMLDKTRTEAQQTNQTQLATISALRRELDRTRQMLEDAREVGADDAERFLGLLDNVQFGSMKNKQNAVRLMAGSEPRRSSEEYDFTQADDDPDFLRRHVPDSKAEAILGLAADEPGGVSTKARQRAADRHRRLDNALSTIASSSYAADKPKQRADVPFPSSNEADTIKEHDPPVAKTTLEPSDTQGRGPFGIFRRRRTSGSKADMPEEHGLSSSGFKHSRYASTRLKKAGSYRRNSDPALSITAATNRRDSLQPRSSMDDTRGKKSGTTHLMPPLTDKAREGGTWGRSASSDVPRGGSMERFVINDPTLPFGDEKKKKDKSRPPTGTRGSGKERRGSFSKIMGKLFPLADPEYQEHRRLVVKA